MQFLDGKLLFSASDLVNFLGCKQSSLDLRDLTDPIKTPVAMPGMSWSSDGLTHGK